MTLDNNTFWSRSLVVGLVLFASGSLFAADEGVPEVTYDGLRLVPDSEAAIAYVKPDADFSGYSRLLILDCYVAFKKNWQRDHNRTRGSLSSKVSDADMERIKSEVAELFKDVFVEKLDAKGGYQVVDVAGDDVLLVRPAIIDLDISAPDSRSTGRSQSFTSSAGAATLYVELYDSVSGEILARAVDRKAGHDYGNFQWATKGSNTMEAKKIFGKWAELLRQRLDEVRAE